MIMTTIMILTTVSIVLRRMDTTLFTAQPISLYIQANIHLDTVNHCLSLRVYVLRGVCLDA